MTSKKQYCTYLTLYSGDKLPKWYYGSGTISKINDGYNGSVSSKKYKNIWDNEQKENPHLFKTRILKRFWNRKIATMYEFKIQKKYNIPNNKKYINLGYASKGFSSGLPMSNNHKTNISVAKKNYIFSKEHKNNISKARLEIQPNGKTLAAIYCSKEGNRRKMTIDNNGKSFSSKIADKSANTMKQIDTNGLSIYQKSGKKQSITKRKLTKQFNLIKNGITIKKICLTDIRHICQALMTTTKINYLGKSTNSKLSLNKFKKLHLIGMYIEEI